MSRKAAVDAASIAEVERQAARSLSVEEFRAWADSPIGPEEMADMVDLIRWFVRRYPTPAARLRSARRRQLQLARTIAHVRAAADRNGDR